jgi:hypothetical protein
MATAQEAFAEASSAQRALNSSRFIPKMAAITKAASEANRLYIFNVGPWSHRRDMGSCGSYFVPACPEGKEFGDPLVIQGIESEPYPMTPTQMAILPKCGEHAQIAGDGDGALFAQQVLGEGPMMPRTSSWRPFGVFISKTPQPSKKDLESAKLELQKRYALLVEEANDLWAHGRGSAEARSIQREYHYLAAIKLKKTVAECPWLGDTQLAVPRETCPGCGVQYDVGILKCRHCGYVLDKQRYDEAVKKGLFAA